MNHSLSSLDCFGLGKCWRLNRKGQQVIRDRLFINLTVFLFQNQQKMFLEMQ